MELTASGALDSVIPLPVADTVATGYSNGTETEDHFIIRDGKEFAGTHIIMDLWQATRLDDLAAYPPSPLYPERWDLRCCSPGRIPYKCSHLARERLCRI